MTGEGLHRLLPAALRLEERYRSRVSTARAQPAPRELADERPGPRKGNRPPVAALPRADRGGPAGFRLEVNDRSLMTRDYGFWLENRLRQRFDMDGVPVVIEVRTRS